MPATVNAKKKNEMKWNNLSVCVRLFLIPILILCEYRIKSSAQFFIMCGLQQWRFEKSNVIVCINIYKVFWIRFVECVLFFHQSLPTVFHTATVAIAAVVTVAFCFNFHYICVWMVDVVCVCVWNLIWWR